MEAVDAINKLKYNVVEAPMLALLQLHQPFMISINACTGCLKSTNRIFVPHQIV